MPQNRGSSIALYGWESAGEYWHGPTEWDPADPNLGPEVLDPARGFCSWKRNCPVTDRLQMALATTVRDLGDCALATIDTDGVDPGPLTILAVIPAHRRTVVRAEFAFELTAFFRFFQGPCPTGSEVVMHDHIHQVLDADREISLVFALCSPECTGDLGIAVSEYIEPVSLSILQWLSNRDAVATRPALSDRAQARGATP